MLRATAGHTLCIFISARIARSYPRTLSAKARYKAPNKPPRKVPIALEEILWMRVSRKTRTIEAIAALISIFHTLENTMQYHCPESKKAVNRDCIQTTPILLWAA